MKRRTFLKLAGAAIASSQVTTTRADTSPKEMPKMVSQFEIPMVECIDGPNKGPVPFLGVRVGTLHSTRGRRIFEYSKMMGTEILLVTYLGKSFTTSGYYCGPSGVFRLIMSPYGPLPLPIFHKINRSPNQWEELNSPRAQCHFTPKMNFTQIN